MYNNIIKEVFKDEYIAFKDGHFLFFRPKHFPTDERLLNIEELKVRISKSDSLTWRNLDFKKQRLDYYKRVLNEMIENERDYKLNLIFVR